MSLSVIPLTILGQITGVTGSGETALYQVSFKSIDGTPLYGVTAVWTDEQAEIEALAAQKSYGVWINPINGKFTIKFAGYTYTGTADLDDPDVLAGIKPIEFNNEAAGGGGSGDFSTCKVTIDETNARNTSEITIPMLEPMDEEPSFISSSYPSEAGVSNTIDVVLYKGSAFAIVNPVMTSDTVTVSGNISLLAPKEYSITGDGTITIGGH